jgi:hypothetical protein
MLIRAPRQLATLGMPCSQVRWQLPPITNRSPWPTWSRSPGPPDFGRSPNGRAVARDAVPVPSHAVATVPVQAEPDADKWLAELLGVMGVERRAGLVKHRMGQRFAVLVASQEPRHPHGAVVHVHLLLPPRHGAGQHIEELVGRRDESRSEVNPGAVGEPAAFDGGAELGDAEFAH